MAKVANMQREVMYAGRWTFQRRIQRKCWQQQQKNCNRNERCDGLINTLDTAKERINELEEIQIQLSKLKCKKKKDTTEYLKYMGQLHKHVIDLQ